MQFKTKLNLIILSLSQVLLLGCSSMSDVSDTLSGRKVDYKKQSRSIQRLDMPPEMIISDTSDPMYIPDQSNTDSRLSQFQSRSNRSSMGQQVLPEQDDIELVKDRDVKYLRIKGNRTQVWNKMREYWINRGMLIKRESPKTGILETEWAENRADIPQGLIRDALGKIVDGLYSAGTKDKYRVRIEQAKEKGISELYLTHYGMEEVQEKGVAERIIWVKRPRDPELEIEMLGSMMVFFGMEKQKTKAMLAKKAKQRKEKAVIARNLKTGSVLLLRETYPRAWRRTGVALERVDFIVEDRDRNNGIYYVRYSDPLNDETKSGWMDSLKFWGNDKSKSKTKYQIKLTDKNEQTLIVLLDEFGQRDTSGTAESILNLLYEQLR
jgi:outer membrane protein assembly factor BamC